MRVGADSGIGLKYMGREDAHVIGMFGSGGMARSHMEAFTLVRPIRRVQVYSPTKAHREEYAEEMAKRFHIEAISVDDPRDVYKGADIIAGCTDSTVLVIIGQWLEEGTHITCVGGMCDEKVSERIDAALRFGNVPTPFGLPEFKLSGNMTYAAMPDERIH
jgi:ornithine cyclodeaminase/alanine dehydrogenase-like protein (mu-crystallin family)